MSILLTTFAIYFLITIITTSTVFLIATAKNDNSIMDIAYGPTFLIATITTTHLVGAMGILPSLVSILVGLWSARLCLRIFYKNYGKPEDARYAAWRHQWQKKGRLYFIFRSYLQIFVLQGVIITLVSSPIILVLANPLSINIWLTLIGTLIWLIGFTVETTADWQLDKFIARKKSGEEKSNFMTIGLFRYSRRPNYFGETLIWWGLAIMVQSLPFGSLAIISPLIITYIVTKITGPMLEKIFVEKFGNEYQVYQNKTSYFFPRIPKN